ncbi:MAG: DUF3307 domain-containing protein [Thermodesulfobacteriota bacterium]
MDMLNWNLVLCLAAAHVLADFLLQTDEQAAGKAGLAVRIRPAFIAAVLSYLLAGRLELWAVPAVIFVSHFLIHLVRAGFRKNTFAGLALDQLAHGLVILLLGAWYTKEALAGSFSWVEPFEAWYDRMMILITGFVLTTHGGAVVVRIAMEPYLRQMDRQARENEGQKSYAVGGLQEGGKSIGQLERALIFLFILVNEPAGLGFLVAAKSIFRFGELKETTQRMQAEYIMIGTLWSFAYGIAVSFGTYQLLLLAGS